MHPHFEHTFTQRLAVRLSKAFGGSAESRLTQQTLYDLSQVAADKIKVKRLEVD
jgi:plasmid maintenance system antidote protein VapI